MKKRYLPPSPLKVAHKNTSKKTTEPIVKESSDKDKNPSSRAKNDKKNNLNKPNGNRPRNMYRWLLVGVAILLVVLVAVYIQKYSSLCFVWQEWAYPHYKNDTECIYIRDNIRKSRPLSTAGFRHVFEGFDTMRKKPVAVKELKCPDGCCGDRKAHWREIYLETHLSHPHIVPYLYSCNIGLPYGYSIVSEYMEGGTLLEGLRKGKTNMTMLMDLMVQLAEGLDYLHNGVVDSIGAIVHDDLNPQHILFSDKTREKLMITDFNLANIISPGSRYSLRRSWWPQGGSWRWFAPEKLRFEYYYEAVDIWSFGVIYYESLAIVNGQSNAWDTVDRKKYETEILSNEEGGWRPPRPNNPRADITDAEWNIVDKCLQYHPDRRPTVKELLSMLRQALQARKTASG